MSNTGIVNVLVSTLYSKPDEVTGYECGLYSTKGGRLKDRISFYTVGLTMMIFDVEVVLTFAFLLSLILVGYNDEKDNPLLPIIKLNAIAVSAAIKASNNTV